MVVVEQSTNAQAHVCVCVVSDIICVYCIYVMYKKIAIIIINIK